MVRGNNAGKTSVVVMFGVLTLLFLYLANVAPAFRILLYFLTSMFVMGVAVERRLAACIVLFLCVTFAAFLLLPDNTGVFPYLFFFGHYGIFKYFVDQSRGRAAAWVLKYIYFNVGFFLIFFLTGGYMRALISVTLPSWLIILLAQVIFAVYDMIFTKLTSLYLTCFRSKLLGTPRY